MAPPNDEFNPYQKPEAEDLGVRGPGNPVLHRAIMKSFREQLLALGVLWIILGIAAIGIGAFVLVGSSQQAGPLPDQQKVLLVVVAVMGAIWFALGVCSLFKQMWAVYAGLALSYLSLLGNLLSLNVCSILLTLAVIFQAHRVISWANKLKAEGVPLDAKF